MNRVFLILIILLLLIPPAQAQTLLHTLEPPPAPISTVRFGDAVVGVPDVDGDGRGDLLVGAPGASIPPTNDGRAFLYSGDTGVLIHILASPRGEAQGSFGEVVAAVPDADGDGTPDLLIGAPREQPDGSPLDAGRAHLFSGATGALLYTLASPDGQSQRFFGTAVAGVPDLDGDGRGDLLIGSFENANDVFISGRAYVFSGATGALLYSLVSPNIQARSNFGTAVAGVSDVNGDERGDLLIGAYGEDDPFDDVGRAYLFSGATGALLHTLESPNPAFVGFFGSAVASVPDADGDGRPDLLVGARYENGTAFDMGRAHLFSSATGNLIHTLTSPNAQEDGSFGWSVSGVPDADGDGRGDLLVGALNESPDDAPFRAGRAYLFSGASGALLTTLASPDEQTAGTFGRAVAGIPDTDGDGRGNLVVGASFEDRDGLSNGGNTYLFSYTAATTDTELPTTNAPRITASAYPNPFSVQTTVSISLLEAQRVRLAVHDVLGREVARLADEQMEAGRHEAVLDGSDLPSGVYLVRLVVGEVEQTQRLTLVR